MAGRTVARVPVGYQTQGSHVAAWTGTTAAGTKAPAGRYLLAVHCTTDDGAQTMRTLAAELKR